MIGVAFSRRIIMGSLFSEVVKTAEPVWKFIRGCLWQCLWSIIIAFSSSNGHLFLLGIKSCQPNSLVRTVMSWTRVTDLLPSLQVRNRWTCPRVFWVRELYISIETNPPICSHKSWDCSGQMSMKKKKEREVENASTFGKNRITQTGG